jgi:hypothetical protein
LSQGYDKDQQQDHEYQTASKQKYDCAHQIRIQKVFTPHETRLRGTGGEVGTLHRSSCPVSYWGSFNAIWDA